MDEKEPAAPQAEGTGVLSALRAELGAGIAISAGLLVATGYILVWARLVRHGLPTENVLSTLPMTVFLGVAFDQLLLPLAAVAVIGATFVVLERRADRRPAPWHWGAFGFALWAVCALPAAATGSFPGGAGYPVAALAGCVAAVLLAAGLGRAVQRPAEGAPGTPPLRVVLAAAVLCCVFTACTMRIVETRYASTGFPLAQIVSYAPCNPLIGGQTPSVGRCRFGALYIGESARWVFAFQLPPGRKGCANKANRLLSLRREQVEQLVLLSRDDSCLPS